MSGSVDQPGQAGMPASTRRRERPASLRGWEGDGRWGAIGSVDPWCPTMELPATSKIWRARARRDLARRCQAGSGAGSLRPQPDVAVRLGPRARRKLRPAQQTLERDALLLL